ALFAAGYGSTSRFYEKPRLGMKAREYRAAGKGQRISYCCFPTELGTVLVAATGRGVCSVKLGDSKEALKRAIAAEFAAAELQEGELAEIRERIEAFLRGEASLARLPLDIRGTVFQQRVWEELRRIPRGETRTYRDIARSIGEPTAVRAG